MSLSDKHSKTQPELKKEIQEMISGSYIKWDKSKEQVGLELEQEMESTPTPESVRITKVRVIKSPRVKLAIAASIALLAGIAAFMQFYTRTVRVPAGQHCSIQLPDHSRVSINAASTLSYKPMLWKLSRKVKMEGEAFFEVQAGRKFEVISGTGTTQVVGTTFNIYSRNSDYQVTCLSGKVKVTENRQNEYVTLLPGQKAELTHEGKLELRSDVRSEQTISWIDNMFSFTSVELPEVFHEIGRQYGVKIHFPKDLVNSYTGTFKKGDSVEQTLNLVCKPFNLKFTRMLKDEYIISRDN
jgi:transmembrane sensor